MLRSALVLFVSLGAPAAQAQGSGPSPNKAGFVTRDVTPASARNWRGADAHALHTLIWYPADSAAREQPQVIGPPDAPLLIAGTVAPHAAFPPAMTPYPLVLLSHGTGGSAMQMAWLGIALARAGFIAAAVDHPGNNSSAPLTAEGFVLWWERATDVSNVLDGLLADDDLGPHIDRNRIGAAGFSIGGYTVLELAGARTDVSVLFDKCREYPDATGCRVPEMKSYPSAEAMLAAVRRTSAESLARSADSFRDPRVKAVFALAPALAQTQTSESLHQIKVPVEIVVGAADPIAPASENADYLRASIHGARETVLTGAVTHYDFLNTCTAAGKAAIGIYCADAPGIDRDAVHAQAAMLAATFFTHALHLPKTR